METLRTKWRPPDEGTPVVSLSTDTPTTGFVIVGPSFVANSAGIGCLYRLCDYLRRRGFSAFMAGGQRGAAHLDAPIVDLVEAARLCSRGYAAIYPETITGNPLGSPTVIRWVLNRPGLLGGDEVYADDELVFSYSDVFRPYIRNRVAGKLYMPTIDESIFHADDWDISHRSLECFYVGKSTWKDGFVDRRKAFEITRDTPAKSELGKLFRAARALYCFDNSTILIYEALLCGCPVVVIPDGTQTKQDYARLELGAEGIAWGIEEFRGESVDVPALRSRYRRTKAAFHDQLDHLIAVSGQRPVAPGADVAVPRADTEPPATAVKAGAPPTCAQPSRRLSFGRRFERGLRSWRKNLQARWKERQICRRLARELDTPQGRNGLVERFLAPRALTCFYVGHSGRWREGVVDRTVSYEVQIHPGTTLSDLVSLFRSARVFYCFDGDSPLVPIALAAGCPVQLVRGDGPPESLVPQASILRAA